MGRERLYLGLAAAAAAQRRVCSHSGPGEGRGPEWGWPHSSHVIYKRIETILKHQIDVTVNQ